MIKCQHKNNPITCGQCTVIRTREQLDAGPYIKRPAAINTVHAMTPREEANALINIIEAGKMKMDDEMFFENIKFKMQNQAFVPTPKIIYWLRDVRDRSL